MSNENPRLTAESPKETMARHTVRFNEVVPDWEPFLKPPVPDNHRAIFQYIGMNGHGRVDPWVAQSKRISLSLIYLPPGQGAPPHAHDAEEVFTVLEGRVTFWWEEGGERAESVLGPKDLITYPPNVRHSFKNTGVEGAWLHIVIGAPGSLPVYDR